jgi:hypothetical protein
VYQRRKFPSAFLECGTTLTVQVDLAFPLEERHEHGNFQRAVVILRYTDTERLHRIEEVVLKRNCEALDGRQTVPLNKSLNPLLLKKSIAAVELDAAQQRDPNLDFISGLQLIDGEFRIFVLEGLLQVTGVVNADGSFTADGAPLPGEEDAHTTSASKTGSKSQAPSAGGKKTPAPDVPEATVRDGAMVELLAALPRMHRNGDADGSMIFWNPDITFETRIYGEFFAVPRRVR